MVSSYPITSKESTRLSNFVVLGTLLQLALPCLWQLEASRHLLLKYLQWVILLACCEKLIDRVLASGLNWVLPAVTVSWLVAGVRC